MPLLRWVLLIAIVLIASVLTVFMASILLGDTGPGDPQFFIIAAPVALGLSYLIRRFSRG